MSFEGSMFKLTLAFLLVSSLSLSYADTVTLTFNSLPTTNEDSSYSTSASDATYNGYVPATINGIFNGLLICDDSAHNTDVPSGPDWTLSTRALRPDIGRYSTVPRSPHDLFLKHARDI